MLGISVAMGNFFALRNPFLARLRDMAIAFAVAYVRPVSEFLRFMKFKPLPRYDGKDGNERTAGIGSGSGKGMFLDGQGGFMLPQVWLGKDVPIRLDDALFPRSKGKMKISFVVPVVFAGGERESTLEDINFVECALEDARKIVRDGMAESETVQVTVKGVCLGFDPLVKDALPIVASSTGLPAGAAKDGYDPTRLHAELGLLAPSGWFSWLSPSAWMGWWTRKSGLRAKFVLVRPDRYVFSVSESTEELAKALKVLWG
jgi:hypothetical protein